MFLQHNSTHFLDSPPFRYMDECYESIETSNNKDEDKDDYNSVEEDAKCFLRTLGLEHEKRDRQIKSKLVINTNKS